MAEVVLEPVEERDQDDDRWNGLILRFHSGTAGGAKA